ADRCDVLRYFRAAVSSGRLTQALGARGRPMQSTKLLSALLIGVGTATSAPAASGETCSVLAGSPSQVVAVPGLAVADLNEDRAFAIPTTAVGKVSAVICDRKSAVPAEFDYKVLQAGLPFAIRSPQDTVWIEIK